VRTLAIWRGEFSEPHVGYQLLALYLLETSVREIWFVPTWQGTIPYEHRYTMMDLLTSGLGPRVRVTDAERGLAVRNGVHHATTLQVLGQLREPMMRVVMSHDTVAAAKREPDWPKLVERALPIVVGKEHEVHEYVPPYGVSEATMERILEGIVPTNAYPHERISSAVLEYMHSHGLLHA